MSDRIQTPLITLNSGVTIPQLGLGVWQASNEQAEQIVRFAIDEAGYRHIDTAAAYENEEGVGRAIAGASVPREDLFVTTKLWNADHGRDAALRAIDTSLAKLGLDHVDLYLIHWPLQDRAELVETWHAMEEIQRSGKARSIGVCNCEPHHLDWIAADSDVTPAVDQVELHPHLPQYVIRAYATYRGIATQSWSPLGGTSRSGWGKASKPNTLLHDPTLQAVAARHGKSVAQVLIRWQLQSGLIVMPKSLHPERVAQNIDVFDFELTGEDFEAIAGLDNGERVGLHPDTMDHR